MTCRIVLVALIITFIGLIIARCNKTMGTPVNIMLALTGFLILMIVVAMIIYENTDETPETPKAKIAEVAREQVYSAAGITNAEAELIDDAESELGCCFNGDYGSAEWDSGFKKPKFSQEIDGRETWLAQTAADTMSEIAEQQVVPEIEVPPPGECCPMRTDWQGSFLGLPTTFITPPESAGGGPCDVDPGNRDKRPYFRKLEDEYYLRSRKNAEIWDPYKHMTARQMYMQFLASGLTNRKAFYERPIEQLEEATCFQNMVQQKNAVCGRPPLVETNVQV